MKRILIIALLAAIAGSMANAQQKGGAVRKFNKDTAFVFSSPRPLILSEEEARFKNFMGFDLLLSENGFGAGYFIKKQFTPSFSAFMNLYISGAKNTDEFEHWIWDESQNAYVWKVEDKVNRLFMFPLMFGVQQNLLGESLSDSFQPFLNCGLGPTFILATPYDKEFFSSFGSADGYTRFGCFAGLGANIGVTAKSYIVLSGRYYYIPFGGKGIESVKNKPITNFGGFFLSASMSFAY